MPTVNWSTDERSTAKPGTYTFEIEHAETKVGKDSGHEYISLRLRCVDDGSISVFVAAVLAYLSLGVFDLERVRSGFCCAAFVC